MTNSFILNGCPECAKLTGGCGNHGGIIISNGEPSPAPVPLFYCSRCGVPQYTREGFCGGCHPGK